MTHAKPKRQPVQLWVQRITVRGEEIFSRESPDQVGEWKRPDLIAECQAALMVPRLKVEGAA